METLLFGIPAVVITGIIVEALKKIGLNSKYAGLVSLVVGIGVMTLGTLSINPEIIITGIVTGAVTSGLYSGTKALVKK